MSNVRLRKNPCLVYSKICEIKRKEMGEAVSGNPQDLATWRLSLAQSSAEESPTFSLLFHREKMKRFFYDLLILCVNARWASGHGDFYDLFILWVNARWASAKRPWWLLWLAHVWADTRWASTMLTSMTCSLYGQMPGVQTAIVWWLLWLVHSMGGYQVCRQL
jgi:hypothetical protein